MTIEHADPRYEDLDLASWSPRSLVEAGSTPPQKPRWIKTFYEGKHHLLVGSMSSLKTWLALIAIVEAIRQGRDCLWADVDGGGDSSGDLLERLHQLGLTDEEIEAHLIYITPDELLSTQRAKEIARICCDRNIAVAVVDSATGSMARQELDPNSAIDAEEWWRQVGCHLEGNDAAVILIDHTGNNPDAANRAAGSARKGQVADVQFQLKATQGFGRGRVGRSKVTIGKDRPGFHPPVGAILGTLRLSSAPETGEVTWEIEPPERTTTEYFRPTKLMERVSDYLETHAGTNTRNQIETNVTGKAEGIRAAIYALLEEKYAVESKSGQALLLTFVRRYRADDDPLNEGTRLPTSSPDEDGETGATSSPSHNGQEPLNHEADADTSSPRPYLVPTSSPGEGSPTSSPRPTSIGGTKDEGEDLDPAQPDDEDAYWAARNDAEAAP